MSPPSRQRPRRSEKPTSAFSTTRLTARRRRPPHPTVRRPPAAELPTREVPAGQRSACRPPIGRHSEQVAPLPHHLGPAVAAADRHPSDHQTQTLLRGTPDPAMAKSDPPVFYALRDLLVSVLAARLRFGLVSGKPKLRCSKRNRSGALYLIIARTRGIIQNTYEIC
jgi:hypothetical protein